MSGYGCDDKRGRGGSTNKTDVGTKAETKTRERRKRGKTKQGTNLRGRSCLCWRPLRDSLGRMRRSARTMTCLPLNFFSSSSMSDCSLIIFWKWGICGTGTKMTMAERPLPMSTSCNGEKGGEGGGVLARERERKPVCLDEATPRTFAEVMYTSRSVAFSLSEFCWSSYRP